ncbi:MAG TPA: hypothetical protein VKT73_16945 [Xanthobacteraceae bacterium]|nr:hypothetical protein [Xanthobacteraceae bacterium]
MRFPRLSSLIHAALIALPLAMAACSDFDLFDEKKTPLAGDRRPLFPGGVPGVNYNQPPLQPTNSNIPIDTQISSTGQNGPTAQPGEYQNDQQAQPRAKTRTARNAPPNQPPSQPPKQPPLPAAQPAGADDPWADARTPN